MQTLFRQLCLWRIIDQDRNEALQVAREDEFLIPNFVRRERMLRKTAKDDWAISELGYQIVVPINLTLQVSDILSFAVLNGNAHAVRIVDEQRITPFQQGIDQRSYAEFVFGFVADENTRFGMHFWHQACEIRYDLTKGSV